MECDYCFDGEESTGYQWDTLQPCHTCDKGKKLQVEQDRLELKAIAKRGRFLRKRIKLFEKI